MSSSSPLLGTSAPDFTLLDQEGNRVSLADERERYAVVLVFYPGDETPGCTEQLCAIRDDWHLFQEQKMMVYGVNPGDAKSHTDFWRRHGLKTPLLVDIEMVVARKYGCTKKFFGKEIVHRTVVGIDQQGIIRYYERGMPSPQKILAALAV